MAAAVVAAAKVREQRLRQALLYTARKKDQ